VINEFLAHTDLPQLDYVELYNHGNTEVDLSGYTLSDDRDTNKFRIPNGTKIAPRGFLVFDETQLGFRLDARGENIYFVNSNATRVVDAIGFEGQANGVSSGRSPDGASAIRELSALTPGAANAAPLLRAIVINEIMYSPISGDADEEFIELYNKGTNAVDVGRWKFTAGIDFTIPQNTTMAPDSYLVIAKNRARILENYPGINAAIVLGNYDGTLANGGERIALTMPDYEVSTNNSGQLITNSHDVVVNEVTYSDGGRWTAWSDGGGSSLELVDAHSDNRRPSNWADSDETAKSSWGFIFFTGTLNESLGTPINDHLQIFLLGIGECLVDNVELNFAGGGNVLVNPGFETGLAPWVLQGSHDWSTNEFGPHAFSGNGVLHLRAASRGDNGANRIKSGNFSPPATLNPVTIRANARWLRGWPELILRIHGGTAEATSRLPVPKNLGTPGARNQPCASQQQCRSRDLRSGARSSVAASERAGRSHGARFRS
jgi:hypothetical protein